MSAESQEQDAFNMKLAKGLLAGIISLGATIAILVAIHGHFIQPQFDLLNKRQEKVEIQVNDIQKQQNGLDKNMAIMVEQIKGIGDNVKDIKDSLKK